jgi:hypothetical protein
LKSHPSTMTSLHPSSISKSAGAVALCTGEMAPDLAGRLVRPGRSASQKQGIAMRCSTNKSAFAKAAKKSPGSQAQPGLVESAGYENGASFRGLRFPPLLAGPKLLLHATVREIFSP